MSAHYFEDDGKKVEEFSITMRVDGEDLTFTSGNGMFSKDELDHGTRILITYMELPASGSVLDLGCGIGIVGIIVKRTNAALDVVQSDVTFKAVSLTRKNAQSFGIDTEVVKSNVYAKFEDRTFDVILLNPPRAAGKDVIRKMIAEAPEHLNTGGSLQLVAMGNKGGASYQKMMQEAFGNAEIIGRGSGFKLYKSVKE